MNKVYICWGKRTAIGRYGGGLANVRPDDMLAHVLKTMQDENPTIDWNMVDDVLVGCANQAGEDNRNIARMAVLLSGLPKTVPATTLNRLCGSGMDAIIYGMRAIQSRQVDLIVAGGVESMSRAPFVMGKSETAFGRSANLYDTTMGWRFINKKLAKQYGTESMPETAENIAERFNISRQDQDAFAKQSQDRTATAQANGFFGDEIIPYPIPQRRGDPVIFETDEHPRPQTTLDGLASLKAPFREGGTVTAGNASGINDGAAAVILASEQAVEQYGLNPMGTVVSGAMAGCDPSIMGMGPVYATEKVLARNGLTLNDIDTIELNEAFAAQALACMRDLRLPDDSAKVNPNGGAIALGHPLGMSGTRLVITALNHLHTHGGKRALCTMCIGVGQGIACLIEKA